MSVDTALETPDEEGEEKPGRDPASENLLDRLLYRGVLPRYAFPTDVATFHVFDPVNFSWPAGCHAAVVEVDVETGAVELLRYVAVDDVGNVINPLIVDGQVHGGIAQGVAQALWEEAVYDADGNLVNGSLAGYLAPTAAELPSFELDRTETASPTNPLGVKGVGETGAIASTPAVVNAVIDALSHLGVTDIDMPTSPQRVWAKLQEVQA